MNPSKLTLSLITLSLSLGCGTLRAAEEGAAARAAKPVTLPPAATKQGVTYASDIKPLFEASCVRCHSGDRAKGRLHLDSLEGVLKGSEDGKVIEPGNSEKSLLVLAVARVDSKTAMPPEPRKGRGPGHDGPPPAAGAAGHEGSGERPPGGQGPRPHGPPPKPLTPEQVGLVRAWIDQGAK